MGAPDEFHDEAHPKAGEITGDREYGEWGQCISQASSTGERCRGYAKGPHGKCYNHGGAEGSGAPDGNQNAVDNDGGAPEDNDNASDHGAFSEHFKRDLTNAETNAYNDAEAALSNPDSAKEIAQAAAAELLMKYKRSGDTRFLRRFEGICDKFNITPADELNVAHSGDVSTSQEIGLSDQDREFLDGLYGGN